MEFKNFINHENGVRAEVGVWHCESCACFHVKAGDVLLTFSLTEFMNFSNAVLDCCTVHGVSFSERDAPKLISYLEN